MTDLTCAQVGELATEYALGTSSDDESRAVQLHLRTCLTCRREAERLAAIGDRLRGLVPDVEPPAGFDERVVDRILSSRPRHRFGRPRVLAALAAVAAVIALVLGLTLPGGHHGKTAELSAALIDHGRTVGSVEVGGQPVWIDMKIERAATSGTVTCEVVGTDGSVTPVGQFVLVGGRGTWYAVEPAGAGPVQGVRVVDSRGTVLASATLPA